MLAGGSSPDWYARPVATRTHGLLARSGKPRVSNQTRAFRSDGVSGKIGRASPAASHAATHSLRSASDKELSALTAHAATHALRSASDRFGMTGRGTTKVVTTHFWLASDNESSA